MRIRLQRCYVLQAIWQDDLHIQCLSRSSIIGQFKWYEAPLMLKKVVQNGEELWISWPAVVWRGIPRPSHILSSQRQLHVRAVGFDEIADVSYGWRWAPGNITKNREDLEVVSHNLTDRDILAAWFVVQNLPQASVPALITVLRFPIVLQFLPAYVAPIVAKAIGAFVSGKYIFDVFLEFVDPVVAICQWNRCDVVVHRATGVPSAYVPQGGYSEVTDFKSSENPSHI